MELWYILYIFYCCEVKFWLLLLICKVVLFFIFNINFCMCRLLGSGCVVVDFVVVVRFVLMFNWLFIFRGSFLDFIWLGFKVGWVLIVNLFILIRINFFLIIIFILLWMILFWYFLIFLICFFRVVIFFFSLVMCFRKLLFVLFCWVRLVFVFLRFIL